MGVHKLQPRQTQRQSREATRQKLLDAAVRLFAEHGYQGTSVEDVAEAAGFSKGAVYYNFDSKDELFEALVEANIALLVSSLESALDEAGTIDEKLKAAQRALAEREASGRGLFELEVLIQAMRDRKLRKRVAHGYSRMRDAIAALIDQQFAVANVEPPLPPDDLAVAIIAGSLGHGLLREMDPDTIRPGLMPAVIALLLRP